MRPGATSTPARMGITGCTARTRTGLGAGASRTRTDFGGEIARRRMAPATSGDGATRSTRGETRIIPTAVRPAIA